MATDPRSPRLDKVLEPDDIVAATGYSSLHTTHCLGDGTLLVRRLRQMPSRHASSPLTPCAQVSAMGDKAGEPRGGFIVLDQDLRVKGAWSTETSPFG